MVGVVEKWNPHAHIRQDLFGCLDLVAVGGVHGGFGTYGIQTTTGDNLAARVAKLRSDEIRGRVAALLVADWTVHVHGWRKLKSGRWEVRIFDMKQGKEIEWPGSGTTP